ncbi:family 10 glycosylhydrolase [Candidatus Sumerlaeota bacterium]|nr:family 10 glycosylhydrolase [Candidatus Sumerlaeota bacterium]
MSFSTRLLCALLLLGAASASAIDIVVDNDDLAPGYVETGDWTTSVSPGYNDTTYRFTSAFPGDVASTATWTPNIPVAGAYDVIAIFRRSTNRTVSAPLTIVHAGGTTNTTLDQSGSNLVVQVPIGTFNFDAGTSGSVTMANSGAAGSYIADAFLFSTDVDDPPEITALARNPAAPIFTDTVEVSATVTDDAGVASVQVSYSAAPSGTNATVPAYDDGLHGDGAAGDNVFGATIPAFPQNELVTYFFTATDTATQATSSANESYTVNATASNEFRAVWADSWNSSFLNASQAQDLVDTCRANNINTIIIEVRKIGDACYNSALEPRATNISGGPSFDPLGHLISLAHDTSGGKKYLQIHAWFVMHRISRGEALDPQHVLVQHPEYIMSDELGNTTGGGSIFIDPGHPGTVDHNVAVIVDCLQNYDIDGINLDYIRYPEAAGEWGYNPVSVARFNAFYNKSGQPSGADPDWDAWRRSNVTNEVKKIYIKTKMIKPATLLTADTIQWGSSYSNFATSEAYRSVFQDWVGWLQEGVIDYNALMNYATSNTRYQGWTDLSLASDDVRGSIIGIGAYLQTTVQNSMDQLLYARAQGAAGLNIYDWGSEVNAAGGATREQFYAALKTQVFPTWVDPPATSWIETPTKGIFEGNVTASGVPVDHALVTIDGAVATAVRTDGSGWYGALELAPGMHELRFSKPGYTDKVVNAEIPAAGNIITVNVDFNDTGVHGWMLMSD